LVTHPDHIATEFRTTAKKARAFSIEQVMKAGVAVSGTVLSPFGIQTPINSSVGAIGQGIRARGPETIRDRASRV
jgi:hypothetical protein